MMPTSNIDSLLKTGVIRNPASGPPYRLLEQSDALDLSKSASHGSKARKVIITQELQNTPYLSHGNVQSTFRYRGNSISSQKSNTITYFFNGLSIIEAQNTLLLYHAYLTCHP